MDILYEDLHTFLSSPRTKLVTYLSKGEIFRASGIEKCKTHTLFFCKSWNDRAVAQAVSRWLPTAAARVRVRVACGFCGG
jgi:hypothetical protein